MIPILDLLTKIKNDQEEYTIIYDSSKEVKFKNIKSFNSLTIELEDKRIPIHKIKEIKQNYKIIWKR